MSEHLEELKKRLYKSGESFDARLRRPELTPQPQKPPSAWQEENKPILIKSKRSGNVWRILGAIFFIAAVGAGAYYYLSYNSISNKRIDISISGPDGAVGGERVTWEVSITNNNNKPLSGAALIFEYPAGSRVLDEGVKGLRAKKVLETIGRGETVRFSFSAYIYGFENENKDVRAALEYTPQGSGAVFSKEELAKITITRSPVGISFDLPAEIRAGQEVEIKVNYVSNSSSVLEKLTLDLEIPSEFVFKSANPKPDTGGKSWFLSPLNPSEKRTISIRGILSGGELEEKSFKASVGIRDQSGSFNIYGQGVATIQLKRPFLEVDAKINGQDSYSARQGESVYVELTYKNNLTVPVENAIIEGVLSGKIYDESKTKVQLGTYRSIDKRIIWNSSLNNSLGRIDPGKSGTVGFELNILEKVPVKTATDKEFKISMHFEIRPGAKPPGYEGADLKGEDNFDIKLISHLQLVRRGFYYSKTMPNTGPIPPKVGQETTFTVVLSVTNSTNELEGVKVRAFLPPYMVWKNKIIPASSVTFDPNTSEIIWDVGDMKAGIGYTSPAKEITFQVGFIPSANQVGQTPELVTNITAEGHDKFTDSNLQASVPSLTLKLESDPKIDMRQTTVVK